jgi:hypothetical protein
MTASEAAGDFVSRIRGNCQGILDGGRDALVPIILDGENAWEYFDRNGRPFLRELYRRILLEPNMKALTVSEALAATGAQPIDHIFPGSWINANFDVWIGAEEDNRAWEYLLRARQTYDQAIEIPAEKRRLAYQELLIAEGSDWNWWYGPEHDSANRVEFDALYRNHLANVYRALDLQPPEELSRPILKTLAEEIRVEPVGRIKPTIDGRVTSYFEWLGAGTYRMDGPSGSMHGRRSTAREAHYGTDGELLYLRIDFEEGTREALNGVEVRMGARASDRSLNSSLGIFDSSQDSGFITGAAFPGAKCAFRNILEASVPLTAIGATPGQPVHFQFSLWKDGLPIVAVPRQGWLELPVPD